MTKVLGDRHNGGRATSLLANGQILKPRSVVWEEALLSPAGRLRGLVRTCWQDIGGLIDALPEVHYVAADEHGSVADAVRLTPLPERPLSDRELEGCGSTLAVCLFFGVYDLHRENMVWGMDRDQRFVMGPVDLECVMGRLPSLVDTHLLPQPGLGDHMCGLSPIKAHLLRFPRENSRARMIAAFCAALTVLYRVRGEVDALVRQIAIEQQALVRIVLRATSHYHQILQRRIDPSKLIVPLLWEESRQLARQDIPYFVRPMAGQGIWYFDDDHRLQAVADQPALRQFRLTPLRDLEGCWDIESLRAEQMQRSALELARYLIDERELYELAGGVEVKVCQGEIALRSHGVYRCA